MYGRKGDGKTAYGAQIKLTANENGVYAHQRSLNNFNNDTLVNIVPGNVPTILSFRIVIPAKSSKRSMSAYCIEALCED